MYRNFSLISIVIWILLSGIILLIGYGFNAQGFETIPLLIGNTALWLITYFSFLVIRKAINSQNPQALLRGKLTSTLIKLFSTVILVVIYVFIRDRVIENYSNIFFFMGIYVVYASIEAMALSQGAKLVK